MSETVGFIGLGIMGQGMAANLAKTGCKVVVWNRSEGKREAFVAEHEGSSAAATPREVVEACDLIYLMLSDLEASSKKAKLTSSFDLDTAKDGRFVYHDIEMDCP